MIKYSLEESLTNASKVRAVGKCVFTKKPYTTEYFWKQDWIEWNNSTVPIQMTPLISLSAEDREFLISGTSPHFWDLIQDQEPEEGDYADTPEESPE
jgi:hypothetical protein